MIERLVGAVLVVVDSVVVELEGLLRGVDGDRHRPHGGHGGHQLLLVARRDVYESHVVRAGVLRVVSGTHSTLVLGLRILQCYLDSHAIRSATSRLISSRKHSREKSRTNNNNLPAIVINSLVRVRGLLVDAAVVLDVLEGVVHKATVAAVVAVRLAAVDQVLLREGDEVPCLAEVLRLQSSGLRTQTL